MRLVTRALLPAFALLILAAAPADAAVHTKSFTFGPIDVDGYQVKQNIELLPADLTPQVNGHITHMKVDVVDGPGGQPVPIQRLMLHHIVFFNAGRKDATCDQFTGLDSKTKLPALAERFYAAGEERAELALPDGYGYRTGSSDRWGMTWMVMNHRPQRDRAYIEYTVTYDDDPNSGRTAVRPYWMDVNNCFSDPVYDVPGGGKRGSTHSRRWDFTMPQSGRIVASGGHVHGGGKSLVLSQPDCGNRTLVTSRPAWGLKGHPFYNVKPVLHEPGPINMTGTTTQQGFPVTAGQRLRLTSNYDGELPHTRVMGIMMFYLASDAAAPVCGPLPGDQRTVGTSQAHRTKPPRVVVPLTGIGPNGVARTISRPPGRTARMNGGASIKVRDYSFRRPNVSIRQGARVSWLFGPNTLHNVTVANGPRGFSSPNLSAGRKFSRRLTKPGTYRIFCALHPVDMTQTVTVRRRSRR